MWAIAGVLLGLVVVASLLGFHAGPHVHLVAGVFGLAAAGWLVAIAATGESWPGLWVLLSADLVISVGVGTLAWKGLTAQRRSLPGRHLEALEGAEGVAVTDLNPAGVVRVSGEQWSAVAANGAARAGTAVQVLRVRGVRLEVWAEDAVAGPHRGSLPRAAGDPTPIATAPEPPAVDPLGADHEGNPS